MDGSRKVADLMAEKRLPRPRRAAWPVVDNAIEFVLRYSTVCILCFAMAQDKKSYQGNNDKCEQRPPAGCERPPTDTVG